MSWLVVSSREMFSTFDSWLLFALLFPFLLFVILVSRVSIVVFICARVPILVKLIFLTEVEKENKLLLMFTKLSPLTKFKFLRQMTGVCNP